MRVCMSIILALIVHSKSREEASKMCGLFALVDLEPIEHRTSTSMADTSPKSMSWQEASKGLAAFQLSYISAL